MSRLHRWLLRLLPAGRRAHDGHDISTVFSEVLLQARREGRSTIPIWLREVRGLVRYGARERWHPPRVEFRLAWRGARARGWQAAIAIVLLATAIGANTVMFVVADALLFRPTTYWDADRIVELVVEHARGIGTRPVSAGAIDEWRQQTDLFEAVEFYLNKTTFLVGRGAPELVPTADVSPGMTALLGVTPRWGRPLLLTDFNATEAIPVLIGETLARERFGAPERAVNQTLETTASPLQVVGVMDGSFRFPNGAAQIWRVLDPRGGLAAGYAGAFPVARLRPGLTPSAAVTLLSSRYEAVGRSILRQGAPLLITMDDGHRRRVDQSVLWFLLAAAICLLATACANIASLELATAMTRTRVWAIHRALGASRLALARIAACEGLLILVPALAIGSLLARVGVQTAEAWLADQLSLRAVNTFDVDARAVGFMIGAAAMTWALTTLPTVFYATRRNTVELLKADVRVSGSRLGTRLRQGLTAAQIALAVLLLTSGVLAARYYLSILRIDKGFDSAHILQVMLTIPPQQSERVRSTETRLADVLRGVPGVVDVTAAMAPPSSGDSPMPMTVQIDGRPTPAEVMVQRKWVEADYFGVVGVPLLEGRTFSAREYESTIVVSDRFARAIGLGGSAVGRRLRMNRTDSWRTITGVVRHVPAAPELASGPDDRGFQVYVLRRPPPPPQPGVPPERGQYAGASWAVAALTVRTDTPNRASDVLAAVRASEPGYVATVTRADDNYALAFSQIALIRHVALGFGALALIVSMAGIYGVMSYLVAGRRREFGIRVALGAGKSDIRRLVVRHSVTMIVAGAIVGLAGCVAIATWVGSTIFGIRTFDPAAFAAVGMTVIAIAAVAVWRPAESAAATDPAVLLRE